MSIFRRTAAYCLVALLSGAGLTSCGSSGPSNDQGTSFLALGFFELADSDDNTSDIVGIGAIDAVLNAESPIMTASGRLVDGVLLRPLMGVENRLSTQFIRLTKIDCSYEVPGSSLAIPSTSTPQGSVLSPAVFEDDANVPRIPQPNPDGDEDNANAGRAQFVYARVAIVPADIFSFLNNNINSLPQLPFMMIATCTGVGVTQSGRVLETNQVSIPVTFFDESEIADATDDTDTASFEEDILAEDEDLLGEF